MMIIELIEKLEEELRKHGDREVSIVFDGGSAASSIEDVEYDKVHNVIDIIGD